MTSSEVTFNERGVKFDSFTAVEDAETVVFHLHVGLGTIAVINCFLLGRDFTEDSLCVHVDGRLEFVLLEEIVALSFEFLGCFQLFFVVDLWLFRRGRRRVSARTNRLRVRNQIGGSSFS